MLDYEDYDDDLPWDGLWEYVLGEDEGNGQQASLFRRHRTDDTNSSDLFEYFVADDPSDVVILPQSSKEMKRQNSNTGTGKIEMKRRISFTRQPSFTRQSSNQSTSTNGSTSSAKRRGFWVRRKKPEESITSSPSSDFLFALDTIMDDSGESESEVSPSKGGKRKPFWKRKNSLKTVEEDRSDLESIDAMLGPWDGWRQSEEETTMKSKKKPAEKSVESLVKKRSTDQAATETPVTKKKTTKQPAKETLSLEWSPSTEKLPAKSEPKQGSKVVSTQSTEQASILLASAKARESANSSKSQQGRGTQLPTKAPKKASIKISASKTKKFNTQREKRGFSSERKPDHEPRRFRCGHKAEDLQMLYSNAGFISSSSSPKTKSDTTPVATEMKKKPVSVLKKRVSTGVLSSTSVDDEQKDSFLPAALLPWNDEGQPVKRVDSTDSSKGSFRDGMLVINPLNSAPSDISVGSSISGWSESQSKKSTQRVKWADQVESDPFESLRKALDPTWLYQMASSDSDSSVTSSANRSAQSEELSSVLTDSDMSSNNVSTGEKGDTTNTREDQQEQSIRFDSGVFSERAGLLPRIDEDASFRSGVAVNGQGTSGSDATETDQAMAGTTQRLSTVSAPGSVLETVDESPDEIVPVTRRQYDGGKEISKFEPQVSELKTIEGGQDIDALILGSLPPNESRDEEDQRISTTTIKSISPTEIEEVSTQKSVSAEAAVPSRMKRSFDTRFHLPICRAIRNLPEEDLVRAMESGIPVHELSYQELAELFPKIRMVPDDAPPDQASVVLGNTNSFDDSRPALLQVPARAMKSATGLQSLYEYDFASGKHMSVLYNSFGADPKSSLHVVSHETPPESGDEFNFAVVQVEASSISSTDCRTRRDGWFGNKRLELPNTPGVDVVGKIFRIDFESSKQTGLKKGDRVISLVSQGGNARFMTVNPASLVKIPDRVDPAEAACLVETYLTAFQVLHYNHSFLTRYRRSALYGKSILIIGGMSANMTRAISQLGRLAGSKAIFATARKKDFKLLSECGILPLTTDPLAWWEQLAGSVDLLISLDEEVIPLHYKLLKVDGTVVVSSSDFHEDLMMYEDKRDPRRQLGVCSTAKSQAASKTNRYDLFEEWEKNRTRSKKDLSHLVDLLEKRKVVPNILDRVTLSKVADIQHMLEKHRVKGHYVCEPWLVSKSRAVSL